MVYMAKKNLIENVTHKLKVINEKSIIFTPCTCYPLFVYVVSSGAIVMAVLIRFSLWAEIRGVECYSGKKIHFPMVVPSG